MGFLSHVSFSLRLPFIFINRPWPGASDLYLDVLDKLEKLMCRNDAPALVASIEPITYSRNVVSSGNFHRY